jgi:hypothetical protein
MVPEKIGVSWQRMVATFLNYIRISAEIEKVGGGGWLRI